MSTGSGSIIIAQVGMLTSVGLDAAMTASSLGAGITRMQESNLLSSSLERVVMSTVDDALLPALRTELLGGLGNVQLRLLRLAAPALAEAARPVPVGTRVPLLLAQPEPCEGQADLPAEEFLARLGAAADVALAEEDCAVFAGGRAGVFAALSRAADLLRSGQHSLVMVGGVDSLCVEVIVNKLDAERRLLAGDATDGLRPGEGAAFLLLAQEQAALGLDAPALAAFAGVGLGSEAGHRYSAEPYRGDGLAKALANALRRAKLPPIETIVAGLNGEGFFAKEWGVSYLRNSGHFVSDVTVLHPAEFVGDAGAALGPIMLASAALGLSRMRLDPPVLVWASSDRQQRGAACLDALRDWQGRTTINR